LEASQSLDEVNKQKLEKFGIMRIHEIRHVQFVVEAASIENSDEIELISKG
jgi:hypothetical protein